MSQSITEKLLALDPTLDIHNEGYWGDPYREAMATGGGVNSFSSFNDAGIECETGELFYSFVRMLKPANVLETGTHFGIGASYMGMALRDNGFGHLDTVEFLGEIHMRATQRIHTLGLQEHVTCHFGDVAKFTPAHNYQFILLDTEPQTRFAEMQKFWDNLDEGGFLFIHDLHRHMHQIPNEEHGFAWPYGPVTEFMKQLVKSGQARPFHFSTPRGLTGFYKVSSQDYDWK